MQQSPVKQSNTLRFCVAFAFSVLGMLAFRWCGEAAEVFLGFSLSNISEYALMLVVFCALFAICYPLFGKASFTSLRGVLHRDASPAARYSITAIVVLLFAGLIAFALYNGISLWLGFYVLQAVNGYSLAAFVLFGAIALWRAQAVCKTSRVSTVFVWCFAAFTVIFSAWAVFAPNCIADTASYEAYWFSPFMLYRGIPVDLLTSSFYGHYGMLMTPIFHLMGGFTPLRSAALLSAETAVLAICMCCLIWQCTKKPYLRLLGMGAFLHMTLFFSPTIAPQIIPHRFLFPVLLLAYAARSMRHGAMNKWQLFGGYAIAAIGLIWSTDTGIACILGWYACSAYHIFTQRTLWRKALLSAAGALGSAVLCVLAAWQAVSVANIVFWHGKAISLTVFLTPYFSAIPVVETLQMPIASALDPTQPWVVQAEFNPLFIWSSWTLVLLVSVFGLAVGAAQCLFGAQKQPFRPRCCLAFLSSVLSLILFVYFFNRVNYENLWIVYPCLLVIFLLAADKLADVPRAATYLGAMRQGLSAAVVLILCALCAAGVGRFPEKLVQIRNNQNIAVVNTFFAELQEKLPEDAIIAGDYSTYINAGLSIPTQRILPYPGNNSAASWEEWASSYTSDPQFLENLRRHTLIMREYDRVHRPSALFALQYYNPSGNLGDALSLTPQNVLTFNYLYYDDEYSLQFNVYTNTEEE